MFDSMSGAMATVLSDAMGITTGIGLARETGRRRMSAEQPVARLLGTARKRDGMVVRTVAGLPVAIGGDTRAPGFSRATRVVRTTGGLTGPPDRPSVSAEIPAKAAVGGTDIMTVSKGAK